MSLGKRIKAARDKALLSLRAMEKRTGISAAKLSKVENDKATLKYPELIAISETLNIPVATLMSSELRGEARGAKPSGRRSITRAGSAHKFEKANKVYHVLCGEMTHYDNHYWRVVVRDTAPGTPQSFTKHPGEEFIMVLKGTLELHTELYEPLILETGDSILFDADMPHAYFTHKAAQTEILVVNSVSREAPAG
jgi:transcriptional regulator with XRE-family HTH domain